jgi:hypothetical protein
MVNGALIAGLMLIELSLNSARLFVIPPARSAVGFAHCAPTAPRLGKNSIEFRENAKSSHRDYF